MTPDEFNKIGSQVQREIFERYFEDINQNVRIQQSEFDYANRVYNTDEKIAEFKTESDQSIPEKAISGTNPFTVPSELYRLNTVTYEVSSYAIELQRLNRNEYYNIAKSKLTRPTKSCPIYLYEDNKVLVYPKSILNVDDIKMQYVKKPKDIRWGHTLGSLNQYIYTDYVYDATSINLGSLDLTQPNITNTINNSTAPSGGIITNAVYTGGSGTGAVFDIGIDAGSVTSITVVSQGSGYLIGDVIDFTLSQFGVNATGVLSIEINNSNLLAGSQQGYVDFELHNSERTEIILNVLMYAGIVIRDPQIVQTAMAQVQKDEVNEKQ
jgi:hypothetical protein